MDIRFHPPGEVAEEQLTFAVVPARYQGRWIFCKHRQRDTWELPGGHREPGEPILKAAHRELWEETGAREYDLRPLTAYSVTQNGRQRFGMLFLADVTELGPLPELEIEKIGFFDTIPKALTYPQVIPRLMERVVEELAEQPSGEPEPQA